MTHSCGKCYVNGFVSCANLAIVVLDGCQISIELKRKIEMYLNGLVRLKSATQLLKMCCVLAI